MDTPCEACGGTGKVGDTKPPVPCPTCRGSRVLLLTACPGITTPQEVWDTIDLVDLTSVALPVSGGWIDQTASFQDAYKLVKSEQAKCKLHLSSR